MHLTALHLAGISHQMFYKQAFTYSGVASTFSADLFQAFATACWVFFSIKLSARALLKRNIFFKKGGQSKNRPPIGFYPCPNYSIFIDICVHYSLHEKYSLKNSLFILLIYSVISFWNIHTHFTYFNCWQFFEFF